MMTTQQPETLRIADDLRHSIAHHGREDAFTLNAYEAEKRLRTLHAEKEALSAGYDAARLEIASLRETLASQAQPMGDCDTPNYCRSVVRCTAMDERRAQAQPVGGYKHALEIRTGQGWKLGGDKVPVLYTDEINGQQVCRDDVWLCTTAAFTAPQPAAQALECGNCFEGKSDMQHDCRKCGGTGAAQALDARTLPDIADMKNGPQMLNLNDRAFWVLGWNECRDAIRDAAIAAKQGDANG